MSPAHDRADAGGVNDRAPQQRVDHVAGRAVGLATTTSPATTQVTIVPVIRASGSLAVTLTASLGPPRCSHGAWRPVAQDYATSTLAHFPTERLRSRERSTDVHPIHSRRHRTTPRPA